MDSLLPYLIYQVSLLHSPEPPHLIHQLTPKTMCHNREAKGKPFKKIDFNKPVWIIICVEVIVSVLYSIKESKGEKLEN